jgi:hypothetical protein
MIKKMINLKYPFLLSLIEVLKKMENVNFVVKMQEEADKNFENVKETLKGLYEVLKINLSDDDIYYKVGLDNIEALYKNVLELLLNDYGTRQLMKKLKNSELDLEINLDE